MIADPAQADAVTLDSALDAQNEAREELSVDQRFENFKRRHASNNVAGAPDEQNQMSEEEGLGVWVDTLHETPEEEPATTLTDNVSNAAGVVGDAAGAVANQVFGLPRNVAGGFTDMVHEFESTTGAIERELEAAGFPTGLYWGPDGLTTTRPYELEHSFASQLLDLVPEVGGNKNHPARLISKWMSGFLLTKRATKMMGLPAALSKIGKTGAVLNSNINGALTAFWALAEDDNLINALQAMGIKEREWMAYVDSREENSELENRLHNALVDFGFGMVVDGAMGAFKMLRANRKAIREAAGEAPDVIGLKQAELDEVSAIAKVQRKEAADLLGDTAGPLLKKKRLPPIEDLPLEDADDALTGLSGRARETPHLGEELSVEYNWARINSPDDVKRIISDTVEGFSDEVAAAKGGVRKLKRVALEADEIDAVRLIEERRAMNPNAAPLNDAELTALRNLHVEASRHLKEVADAYRAAPSKGKMVAGVKMLSVVREIQRQFSAAKAQASRTLGSLRIPAADSGQYALVQEMDDLIAMTGDDIAAGTLLKAISLTKAHGRASALEAMVEGMPGLLAVVRKGQAPVAAVRSLYYFAMLGRLSTQIRNVVGNTAHFALQGTELGVARMINVFADNPAGIASGEASDHFIAGLKTIPESFRLGRLVRTWGDIAVGNVDDAGEAIGKAFDGGVYKAFREGASGHGIGKVETPQLGGFSAEMWGFDADSNVGRVFNAMDAVFSIPQRTLVASDEVFKNMFYRAEGQVLARRQATQELMEGIISEDQLSARMIDLTKNPTGGMLSSMQRAAQEGTFTQQVEGGALYGAMAKFRRIPVVGKLSIPFQNTPYNIANSMLQRSPLAPMMQNKFWGELLSGDAARVQKTWSRFLLGNFTIMGLIDVFRDNGGLRIVGDTERGVEREQSQRIGKNNMQIQIALTPDGFEGDFMTIPYRGTEPIAYPLGVAANYLEIMQMDEFEDTEEMFAFMMNIGGVMATQFMSANMVSSWGDFFEAVEEPLNPRSGLEAFFKRGFETVMTPGLTAQMTPIWDPISRETFDTFDRIRARTPGLSDTLGVAYDAWGRPKRRMKGYEAWIGSLSPKIIDRENMEPIDHWLESQDEAVGRPKKSGAAFRPGVEVNWEDHKAAYSHYVWLARTGLKNPQEELDLQKLSGVPGLLPNAPAGWIPAGVGLRDELNMLVEGKHPFMQQTWDILLADGEDGGRANFVRKAIRYYDRMARELMLHDPEYSDLRVAVKQAGAELAETEEDPIRRLRLTVGLD